MKKLLLILLVFPTLLLASPVDPATALQVAENFINATESSNTNARKMPRQLKRMVSRSASAESQQYYIFNSEDSCGFVIVSADNCATPILGYSTEGYMDINDMPIQLKDLLQAYNDEIQYAIDNNIQAEDSIKDLWNRYRTSSLSRNTTTVVNALISTTWNQYPYYNIKCPADASLSKLGGHPTTGCVATAMAQIMKYWEYPNNGIGSKSYKSDHYGTLSANFSLVTYEWENMPIQLSNSSTSNQINAVAALMYHCGVAVSMKYNDDGDGSSSASTLDYGGGRASAEEALKTYFGYATSVKGIKRSSYSSNASWNNVLKNELDSGRPMLYRGNSSTSNSGHCFICDGYDSNDKFHFNWGWGGKENGFFTLTALTPGGFDLSSNQQAVIGIKPKDGSRPAKKYDLYMNTDLNAINTKYSSTSSENVYDYGSTMSFTAKIENNGTGIFNGSFKVAIFTNSGEFIAWSKESYHFSLGAGETTVKKTYTFDGGIPFVSGTYRAYMYYQDDDETACKLVKTDEGIILTEYNNVEFSIVTDGDLKPVSSYRLERGSYVVGSTVRIEVDVLNTAFLTNYYGSIRLSLFDTDGDFVQNIDELDYSSGFSPRATKTLSFFGVLGVEPGSYLLTLTCHDSNNPSGYLMGCNTSYPNPITIKVTSPVLIADDFEVNNTQSTATILNWVIDSEMDDFSTLQVSLHEESDVDYYKLSFPKKSSYSINVIAYDKYNQGSQWYQNADVEFAYSIGGINYTDFYKNSTEITFDGPTTLYLLVKQYGENGLGYYELAGNIEETAISALDEINERSVPSKYFKEGQLYILREGSLYSVMGSIIK